jgi:hypothetical protein
MALTDNVILLAGLMEIVFPSRTVRLCDGGYLTFEGNSYTSSDAVLGTIGSVDGVTDAIGDEAASGRLTFLPPEGADLSTVRAADAQASTITFWLAEVSAATGAIIGTPESLFYGMIDTVKTVSERGSRRVEIEFVDAAERLFMVREGNVLSPRFHKTMWPGELGFDHATGSPEQVAWGTSSATRGVTNLSGTNGPLARALGVG